MGVALLADAEPIPFVKEDVSPLEVAVACQEEGATVAEVVLQRGFVAPGVERIAVRERGLVGTFFQPPRSEPGAAVLVLGGSDGGLEEHQAALTRMLHPITGQVYELGGSPEANGRASRDAWARVLAFLGAL